LTNRYVFVKIKLSIKEIVMANDNSISSDLIRGHIDTIILRALYDGDKHANEICLDIEDKSGGEYEIKQPTLYSALKRLETTGLVDAYWASGVNGRKRYFKLTDNGKQVCEDNLNLWIHSRNVIDKLISDGGDLGYPVFEPAPIRHKFDPSEYENYSFASPSSPIYDDFEPQIEEDDQPIETQEPAPVLKTVDDTDPDLKQQARENEKNLTNLEGSDADVTQLSLIDEPISEEDPQIEADPQPIVQETIEPQEEPIDENEVDDYLVIEPYSSPNKLYYDILEKLFPTDLPDEVIEEEEETEEDLSEEETEDEDALEEYEVNEPLVTVTAERAAPPVAEAKEPEQEKPQPKNPNDIDYTDILSLAAMQGFKVKTSDRTNFAKKGKLYVNKLTALSSTILLALMIVEALCLCLPLKSQLGFGWLEIICILIGLTVYPIITYVLLIIKPNKAVDSLVSMKYAITASLVAVLNLVLLTLSVTLILQINLYEVDNLLKFVLLPCILYLNIPLFYIIKYLLLSKEVCFTKEI